MNSHNTSPKTLRKKSLEKSIYHCEKIFNGNCCIDIDKLCFLAKKYHAHIYLDEAHAMGILGKYGEALSVNKDILISLGTFGKAFGSFGAFVCCSNKLKDYLINYCSGMIYTTALPPPILGAIEVALDLIPKMEKQRNHIFNLAKKFKKDLLLLGYKTTNTTSHIIPLIAKSESNSLKLFNYLFDNGIYSVAIRPPTVPQNMSRIRFALSSKHTEEHINKVIKLLKNFPDRALCQN